MLLLLLPPIILLLPSPATSIAPHPKPKPCYLVSQSANSVKSFAYFSIHPEQRQSIATAKSIAPLLPAASAHREAFLCANDFGDTLILSLHGAAARCCYRAAWMPFSSIRNDKNRDRLSIVLVAVMGGTVTHKHKHT